MQTMTDPAPIPPRLSPDEARARLVAMIEMGYGPIDGRDGPDDTDTDDGEEEAG